jgi:hypothetical protein
VKTQATTQFAAGVPFISDTDLKAQLHKADVPAAQADAVVQANSDARLSALRTSLWVVALFTVAALFVTGLIPVEPAGRPERKADPARAGPARTG